MNPGKIFEQEVKDSIPDGVFYHRIKDPAQSFGGNSTTRFSLHNEFDAFIYSYPILVAAELKSTQSTSISFSLTENKNTNIKKCQIYSLLNASQFNIRAGLLLNFRKTEKTYWIDINNFYQFTQDTTKKSVNENDILNYAGVIIPQHKKRVRYTYDLSCLFKGENVL